MLNPDIWMDKKASLLSDEEFTELAALHGALGLEKDASAPGWVSALGAKMRDPKFVEGLKRGAGTVLGGMAIAGGVHAGVTGSQGLMDKVKARRSFRKIMKVNPHILEENDEKDVRLAFNTVQHLNPTYASDPLVGGAMVEQVLRMRDPMDPKRFNIHAPFAGELVRNAPRKDTSMRDTLVTAATQGLSDHRRHQGAAADQQFKKDLEKLKHRGAAERDALKADLGSDPDFSMPGRDEREPKMRLSTRPGQPSRWETFGEADDRYRQSQEGTRARRKARTAKAKSALD